MTKSPDTIGQEGTFHSEVPAMFSVAGDGAIEEYIDAHEIHHLQWEISDVDRHLAPIAGWNEFPLSVDGALADLEIPSETRNAGSVLGGTEAWVGEKSGIIEQLCNYVDKTHQSLGQIDVGANLDSIGVVLQGSDNKVFFAPPHRLSTNQQDVADWLEFTKNDLKDVLDGDPRHVELIDLFTQRVVQAGLKEK